MNGIGGRSSLPPEESNMGERLWVSSTKSDRIAIFDLNP